MNKNKTKVFGVGLNKTGTTTLAECGKILGLQCTSCNRGLLEDYVLKNNYIRIEEKIAANDFFVDWPWPLIYKMLDETYPRSKFILTVRKSDEIWFESLKRHSLRTHPKAHYRKLAYGFNYPHNHKQEHLDFYNEHNGNVREHFRNRSDDFLEICWENGDDLQKLGGFLNIDCPDIPTPNANKASGVNVNFRRVWANRLLAAFS